MNISAEKDFVSKKAYEISYAIIRIADAQKDQVFRDHLVRFGYDLLQAALAGEYEKVQVIHTSLEQFVRLGTDTNRVTPLHLQVLFGEFKKFGAAVSGCLAGAKEEVRLDNFFTVQAPLPVMQEAAADTAISNKPLPAASFAFAPNPAISISPAPAVVAGPGNSVAEYGSSREEDADGFSSVNGILQKVSFDNRRRDSASVRQSAILGQLRESGNCHLKDLLRALPDVSERTIRYDLQGLIERGLVERVGPGGPATYYRVRNF